MEQRVVLEFRARSLQQQVGIWFYIWQLPLFKNSRTEVITESRIEDGHYRFPLCIGADVFAALIRDVHPRLLICDAKGLTVKLGLSNSVLEMTATTDPAASMMEIVRQHVLKLKAVPPVRALGIGCDYGELSKKMKSKFWMETLLSQMEACAPAGELHWLAAGESTPRRGLPPANAKPSLIYCGEGDGFIVYDADSDRLTCGTAAPDLWSALKP